MGTFRSAFAVLFVAASWGSASADTFRIEIDWMQTAGHSHQPSQTVLNAVIQMFACAGHTLIIDLDEEVPHYNVMPRNPDNCDSFFGYSGEAASFGALRNGNFDHAGDANFWHYCIFGHQYEDDNCATSGSSGLGQRPGQYFVVTLGSFSGQTGTAFDQASTLAHEFGHNLNLTHCGQDDCDAEGNYNPILTSTMSYRYQLGGVRNNVLCNGLAGEEAKFKEIDYSHGRNCSVNEVALNENIGTYMTPVDWDCDGSFEGNVAQDIGGGNAGWCGATGTKSTLSDVNEWSIVSAFNDSPHPIQVIEEISCITAEEWEQVQRETEAAGGCSQPTLAVEGCVAGENVFVGPLVVVNAGTCTFPFSTPALADSGAPNNSIIYVKPGTYDAAGAVTLDKPATWMCPTGTATLR
ncbi:MAG: hypothetical protein HOP29_05565 [Phycisphaerales bacterium]|nr:hypothetical protein [Phycisphaerales bacterium]